MACSADQVSNPTSAERSVSREADPDVDRPRTGFPRLHLRFSPPASNWLHRREGISPKAPFLPAKSRGDEP
jgi:hypothetical protein